MKQILKLSIVTIIEVLLLWLGSKSQFGEILLERTVLGDWALGLLSGLLLLLNLLPLVANHRKYGLHYVVLLLLLAIMLFLQWPFPWWGGGFLFPFLLVPILMAFVGYFYLSPENGCDSCSFPVAVVVACVGMELFLLLNLYLLNLLHHNMAVRVSSAGMDKYGYALFLCYFFGSVIQNLLLWYKVRRATLFSVMLLLLTLSIGLFLARRYPFWMVEGVLGAIITLGGQYLIVRCLRRSSDRKEGVTCSGVVEPVGADRMEKLKKSIQRIVKTVAIVVVQLLLLWVGFDLLRLESSNSAWWFLAVVVPLLVLNLLPLYRNHQKYGLQYVALLLLLSGMVVVSVFVDSILALCLPFVFFYLFIANVGYVYLSTDRFRDYLFLPALSLLALVGIELFLMMDDDWFFDASYEEKYSFLLGGYFIVSTLLNLLVAYKIGRPIVSAGLVVVLWSLFGILFVNGDLTWSVIWGIVAIGSTVGQYLIVRRFRNLFSGLSISGDEVFVGREFR